MKTFWNLSNVSTNRVAIIDQLGKKYTYEHLNNDIFNLSKIVKSSRKQLVMILTRNNYFTLVSYLTTLQTGKAAMLMNADIEENLLNSIIDTYQPYYIIGEINHVDYLKSEEGIYKRIIEPSYEIHKDLSLLLSTSGTTGSVKFVRLSYQNINSNAKSITKSLQISSADRGLANLPIHYSYGLSVINSHLYAGATILLTNESVISKELWEFIKREKATSLSGVPYTYQMLQRIGFEKMELPFLRYFTQAGGRLNEKLVRHFGLYAKEHDKKFYVMYGQTEASPRISLVPSEFILEKPTSIGKAIPNGRLALDPETSELIYEGPNVMLGYAYHFSDLSKGDELQGRLRTGDLAEVDEDGFYYIKGRIKRFIKLFGLRINLDEIEKKIESALNVNIVCIGSDDKLVVLIFNDELKYIIQDLIENLYKLHRSAFRIKVVSDIPRLQNGKVNYEMLKDMFV